MKWGVAENKKTKLMSSNDNNLFPFEKRMDPEYFGKLQNAF